MFNQSRRMRLFGPAKRGASKAVWIATGMFLLFTGVAKAQLSGTYTICASGCSYSTIQSAATDLKSKGVSGAVTMSIKAGSYSETITMGSISGASASNTITFKGAGSKPTDVWWYSTTGTPLTLSSASYINLDNIHLETQYYYSGYYGLNLTSSTKINVTNCRITCSNNGSYIYGHRAVNTQSNTDVLFKNNYIRGGGYECVGDGGSGYNTRMTFDGNTLTRWYYFGFYNYGNTDCKYLNNTLDSCSSGSPQYGMYLYYEGGSPIAKGNTIKAGGYYPIMPYYPQSGATWTIDSNYVLQGYYGIYTYCGYTNNKYIITRNRIRNQQYYGMLLQLYGDCEVNNNMIDMASSGNYGIYLYPYTSSCNFKVFHNTIYQASNYGFYLYNNGAKNIFVQNNLIAGGCQFYYAYNLLAGNKLDGNNIVKTSGTFATINGTGYSSLATVQAALMTATGFGSNEQATTVTFAGAPGDLHLDHTNPAPFGFGVGIAKDYDGDVRCTIMPTVGADETKNKNGDNFKTISGTKFTGSAKSYIAYPTVFFNSVASSSRLGFRWYVDGKLVSDSMHLRTTALKYPKSIVKLEAYNCSSIDSFKMVVTVDSPPSAPTSDFISDVNVIRQGETVMFTDLSTGYPSSWKWSITPAAGPNGATHAYTYGKDVSQVVKVRFDEPGMYRVCLTASNAKGKGTVECKADYIEVTPSVTMKGGTTVLTGSSGLVYDNGGPNGTTKYYWYGQTPKTAVLIDGCFDSVYATFKAFDLRYGYEMLRAFEGKDATGKALHKCLSNPITTSYGPGFTGLPSNGSCSPQKSSGPGYDTIKASKSMYLEFENDWGDGSSNGFELFYWTKPRSQSKPKASFTSIDSICTNGQVNFTNTTTGSDITYLWDLDDDMSFFEATSKNTNWPYFAPGKYKITLIATNCGGPDTFSKTITVYNPKTPVTSFTADNVTPTTNDVVFFSKDMPMCVDDYTWTITASSGPGKATYVNGTKNTSSNPNVMFSDPGCYDVQLVSKNVSGTDQLKLTCFINVRSSYCVPTTQNKAADLGISNVKFNTIDNTSSQGTTPYTNYTLDQTKATTIEIGVTYDLTVARTTNKNKITRTAWVDWNADGDFDDAGEKVGEQTNSSSLSWTTPVKVPTLAKTGATLLRIAVNQGTQTNTPCGPNVFGEFEDYRLYVRPDATKPVIKLVGADTVKIEQGAVYTDAGATATDNLDGNVTSKIKVTSVPKFDNMTPGTYFFKYNVTDAAGNQGDEIQRVVIVGVDKTAPNLVVPQPETIYVEVFDATFVAPDAVLAEDLVDGDLLSEVKKTSNVNINVVGTYEVVYTVTDASGNTATVKRTIVVEDKTAPVLALVGNQTVTLEVGSTYTDGGVTVSDNYYSEAELRSVLVMQGNVDANVLGTYTIVYTLTDPSNNGPVTVTRTVIVVDTQAPVLTVKGQNPVTMEVNNKFEDPGVVIADNYDKNLNTWDTSGTFYATFKDGFANQLGSYVITYTVTDGSGNVATVTRTVIVKDMTPPTVNLLGEPGAMACRWSNYKDAGIEATDNFNKPSELTITEEGSFTVSRTQIPGQYYLRYKVADKSGNVTYTAWRGVQVVEANVGGCMTSINEGAADKYVNVYPNPSTGKFTVQIELPAAEQTKITVTNLVGQQVAVVSEGMMSSNTITVDLSNQASGVYLLNIQTATHMVVKRIVVSK